MPPIVGLVMIVKDEEAILERALLSARPYISTYVIVDTGSTDGTKEVIRLCLADLSGQIIDRPWTNFGVNRSEALALCDGHMDWALMLDADDNMAGVVTPSDVWTHPTADGFALRIQHGAIWHQRIQIFRTGIGWAYEGVVHESPVCRSKDKANVVMLPPETYMVTRCEGARSRDPLKYQKDAALIEAELVKKPDNSRLLFYLAQSYRDAGNLQAAIATYYKYLDVSGSWTQETYTALVNLINLITNETEKIRLTWRAIELCPDRVEAPFTLLSGRRKAGLPVTQQIYAIGAAVTNRVPPPGALFVNPAIYEWGLDDELAIAAFSARRFHQAYEASIRCAMAASHPVLRENALTNARLALTQCKNTG